MALHLVNDLLRWKGVILAVKANVADSLGPNEGIKRLKGDVDVTTFVCVSFFDVCQRL